MNRLVTASASVLGVVLAVAIGSAQHSDMKHRGALAMGFDQSATTHKFGLTATGGFIQVTVNRATDAVNLDAIRAHLREVAGEFASGDFGKPMLTHNETPPGAETMRRLAAKITYTFEEIERGGRVRIATGDRVALRSVHDFLRYQIREHATGDSVAVQK